MTFALLLTLFAADPAAGRSPIAALAVAPGGKEVVAGSQGGVAVLSLPKLEVVRSLATALVQVHDLAFSPRGDLLAMAGGSPGELGRVELWQWPDGTLMATLPAGGDVAYRLAFSGDGLALAIAGGDKKVHIQPVSGEKPMVAACHSAAVLAVAWLPKDDLVLSAGVDQSIRVLEAKNGVIARSLDNHTAAVRDLAVRPGENRGPPLVASCGADRTVRLWQPTIGRLVRFVRLPSAPTAICWTVSGSHVLAACEDGRLRAVDPDTIAVMELSPHLDGWAHAVAVTPDGRTAILGGERGQLRIVPLDAIKP